MSAQQSTKESDDLAIHTILDEVHDQYDDLDARPVSLGSSLSRIVADAQQLRYLASARADEERAFVLEFAARLVSHIDLIDRLTEAERAEVTE